MSIIFRISKWLWRAWPALIFLFLLCIHMLLIYYIGLNSSITNKTISLLLQIVGGLLILYSINSNIGVIRDRNLFTMFVNYLNDFPLMKRTIVANVCIPLPPLSMYAKTSIDRNPETIEEKIEYLQEQLNWLKQDCEQEMKNIKEKIEHDSKEMQTQVHETKASLDNIESKMEEVSVGGIKVQLFGVLLMVYGAITGYVA